MASKEKKDSFRKIDKDFADRIKECPVFKEFFLKHKDKVIIGIRDNYINLYYNCDSIAKINNNRELSTSISSYYLGDTPSKTLSMRQHDLATKEIFEKITSNSDKRHKLEKQSQEKLFLSNNSNPDSKWFCIDLEYTKSFSDCDTPEDWRFDIIAVSKSLPHKVALIELKYGDAAIGGSSGINKHIKDYYHFHTDNSYEKLLPEIISIIDSLNLLDITLPEEIKTRHSKKDFCDNPEYYFVTLDNNPNDKGKTPQMTMSGYLFNDHKWGCKKISSKVNSEGFNAIVKDKSFRPTFLFSKAKLPLLSIDDIINSPLYEEGKY
jgi:hypothetical protein